MVCYRQATWNDLERLIDLIEKGFSVHSDSVVDRKQGKEHRVLFSYLYSKKSWNPEWVYLVEDSGRLAAAVGFFPQWLFFDGIEIPVWSVSPVVTDPEFRGNGYAGSCLIHGLEELKKQGIPAVFLWGLPKYYPRFGFVPLLPRYKTKLLPCKINEKIEVRGGFRFVETNDLPKIASIYNNGNVNHWLQPKRDLKWWRERYDEIDIKNGFLKEVPFPKKENFLVWENYKGEVKGYLNYLEEPGRKIVINDSAATEVETAKEMVASFMAKLLPGKTLYIRGTPLHNLNNAAYRLGGTHINPAPLAGMVKILDWQHFIKLLLPLINERTRALISVKDGYNLELADSGEQIRWMWRGSMGWELDSSSGAPRNPELEKLVTKLILGFYDSADLGLVQNHDLDMIQYLFPRKYPFIWDNNYLY